MFSCRRLALYVPGVSKALPERGHKVGPLGGGAGVNEPNPQHCRLLPSRAFHLGREQQTAATEQCNELTPLAVERRGLPPLCTIRRLACALGFPAPSTRHRVADQSLGQT